jgi:hypothetical protein
LSLLVLIYISEAVKATRNYARILLIGIFQIFQRNKKQIIFKIKKKAIGSFCLPLIPFIENDIAEIMQEIS